MSNPVKFEQFTGEVSLKDFQLPEGPLARPEYNPDGYRTDKALVQAVNVALSLNRPLLITGDPGTGKTQLAYRVAAELSVTQDTVWTSEVQRFNTKSSSTATELYYLFDSVGFFTQSQLAVAREDNPPQAHRFFRPQALGRAILMTQDPNEVKGRIGGRLHERKTRSVVLIDELDKAPRDFPNDLLNQVEDMQFDVPELVDEEFDGKFKATPGFGPLVIVTSNSERQLPEAFLRRCVYHHVEFPELDELTTILANRLGKVSSGPARDELISWFLELRKDESLLKKPSTSELIDWLRALNAAGLVPTSGMAAQLDVCRLCLGSLLKTHDDWENGLRKLNSLAAPKAESPAKP